MKVKKRVLVKDENGFDVCVTQWVEEDDFVEREDKMTIEEIEQMEAEKRERIRRNKAFSCKRHTNNNIQ